MAAAMSPTRVTTIGDIPAALDLSLPLRLNDGIDSQRVPADLVILTVTTTVRVSKVIVVYEKRFVYPSHCLVCRVARAWTLLLAVYGSLCMRWLVVVVLVVTTMEAAKEAGQSSTPPPPPTECESTQQQQTEVGLKASSTWRYGHDQGVVGKDVVMDDAGVVSTEKLAEETVMRGMV